MLGNCEKMLLIPSATNEWSQQQQHNELDDQKAVGLNNNDMASVAAAATAGVGGRVLDHKVVNISHQQHLLQHQQQNQQQQQQQQQQQKQQQEQQQQQQQQQQEPLRCPRCDSANTKFCYYNNYSLSQPRHFCKACKRYWTRGGTLRNVPVGGGCRKNKRVKRPPNNSSSSTTTNTNNNNSSLETSVNSASSGGHHHQIHELLTSASNHMNNPLFYGLATNHHHQHNLGNSEISFPFSRYDLQNPPQINGLGLGFSSGLVHNNMNNVDHGEYRNGLNSINLHNAHLSHSKQLFQDLISSNPLLSNYAPTTTSSTSTSTISSLLGMKGGANNFQTNLPSYEESMHMKGSVQGGGPSRMFVKDVKMELEGRNRSFDHHWSSPSQNQVDHNMGGSGSSDPSLIWGNGPNLGAWLDPNSNNLGSSVPSLI